MNICGNPLQEPPAGNPLENPLRELFAETPSRISFGDPCRTPLLETLTGTSCGKPLAGTPSLGPPRGTMLTHRRDNSRGPSLVSHLGTSPGGPP
jgi:hypothetical protein